MDYRGDYNRGLQGHTESLDSRIYRVCIGDYVGLRGLRFRSLGLRV